MATVKKPSDYYEWNNAISGSFYCVLQEIEVILRNAIHLALTERYGKYWYDNPEAGLDFKTLSSTSNTNILLVEHQ